MTLSSKTEVRLGVLGADRRGLIALPAHRPEEGVRITAACSLHPERLERYRALEPEVLLTDDYRRVVEHPEVDAVFVCTPDFLHEEHALAAIAAGKSVFLEKPLAITIEGCDRIITAAQRAGVKLFVGHNLRFSPTLLKMRELIAAGRIGQVQAIWCRHFISYGCEAYFKDWHSERRNTMGMLLQKGAHDLDVIHWLAGGYTRRVVGMGKLGVFDQITDRHAPGEAQPVNHDFTTFYPNWPPLSQKGLSPVIDIEDHSMILLQLDNGVQASYAQCHFTPDSCRNYTVIGTEGRIENEGDSSSPEQWASVHLWNRRTGFSSSGHEVFRIPHLEAAPDHSHGGIDLRIVNDFIASLRGEEIAGATPLDARMAVAAGYLGTRSLREGNLPFDVPPFPAG